MNRSTWVDKLRALYEGAFSIDWDAHTLELNRQLGLEGGSAFRASYSGLPPIWFSGDVEALLPNSWTLVISLNHQISDEKTRPIRESMWEFCRTHNRKYYYPRFFRPLVMLASSALGDEVTAEDEPEYDSKRMAFVEICPYASQTFALPKEAVLNLVATDSGCMIESPITSILLEDAEQALVLVNGVRAIEAFESVYQSRIGSWDYREYQSVYAPTKRLRHFEGLVLAGQTNIPVIGFPFLRTPSTHNAFLEIEQLGRLARDFIDRPT